MPRPLYLPVNHTFGWANSSTGVREINVLHGAHSPPARTKINGVIYMLQARPAPEEGPATSFSARVSRTPHTPSPTIALLYTQNRLGNPQPLLLRGGKGTTSNQDALKTDPKDHNIFCRYQHLPLYRFKSIQGRNPQRGESYPGTAKPIQGIS